MTSLFRPITNADPLTVHVTVTGMVYVGFRGGHNLLLTPGQADDLYRRLPRILDEANNFEQALRDRRIKELEEELKRLKEV